MGNDNKPDLNRTGGSTPPSRIDLLSGKHTTSIVVAILILILFTGLIVVVCVKDKLPEELITGIIGLLGVLAGFFAGNLSKSVDN